MIPRKARQKLVKKKPAMNAPARHSSPSEVQHQRKLEERQSVAVVAVRPHEKRAEAAGHPLHPTWPNAAPNPPHGRRNPWAFPQRASSPPSPTWSFPVLAFPSSSWKYVSLWIGMQTLLSTFQRTFLSDIVLICPVPSPSDATRGSTKKIDHATKGCLFLGAGSRQNQAKEARRIMSQSKLFYVIETLDAKHASPTNDVKNEALWPLWRYHDISLPFQSRSCLSGCGNPLYHRLARGQPSPARKC